MFICKCVAPLLLTLLLSSCARADNMALDERYTEKFRSENQKQIDALSEILNSGRKDIPISCQPRRGDLYLRMNHYDEALRDLKTDPREDTDLLSLVEEHISEPEDALKHVENAIAYRKKINSAFSDIRAERATLAALLGYPELAINDIDSLFERGFKSQHEHYRNLKSLILINKGEHQKASALLRQVLENEPKNRTAYYLGCRLNLETHQPSKALPFAHDQISLISGSVDRYATPLEACNFHQRAMVYAALNKPERVAADLHMAELILKQNHVPESVPTACAKSLAAAGNKQAAKNLIEQEKKRLSGMLSSLDSLEKDLH